MENNSITLKQIESSNGKILPGCVPTDRLFIRPSRLKPFGDFFCLEASPTTGTPKTPRGVHLKAKMGRFATGMLVQTQPPRPKFLRRWVQVIGWSPKALRRQMAKMTTFTQTLPGRNVTGAVTNRPALIDRR